MRAVGLFLIALAIIEDFATAEGKFLSSNFAPWLPELIASNLTYILMLLGAFFLWRGSQWTRDEAIARSQTSENLAGGSRAHSVPAGFYEEYKSPLLLRLLTLGFAAPPVILTEDGFKYRQSRFRDYPLVPWIDVNAIAVVDGPWAFQVQNYFLRVFVSDRYQDALEAQTGRRLSANALLPGDCFNIPSGSFSKRDWKRLVQTLIDIGYEVPGAEDVIAPSSWRQILVGGLTTVALALLGLWAFAYDATLDRIGYRVCERLAYDAVQQLKESGSTISGVEDVQELVEQGPRSIADDELVSAKCLGTLVYMDGTRTSAAFFRVHKYDSQKGFPENIPEQRIVIEPVNTPAPKAAPIQPSSPKQVHEASDSNLEQAFRVAFAGRTSGILPKAPKLSFQPVELIEIGEGLVALFSISDDPEQAYMCHGCTGALIITYLNNYASNYTPTDPRIEAVLDGSPWGQPPEYRVDSNDGNNTVITFNSGTWGGDHVCWSEAFTLLKDGIVLNEEASKKEIARHPECTE